MRKNGSWILDIDWDAEGIVVSRPNRFVMIADVISREGSLIEGERVHVHDPGRLKEIIYPGNRVRLRKAEKEGRSTAWTLISGMVNGDWVLVNSSFHRKISETILKDPDLSPIKGIVEIKPEVKVGSSRIDFMVKKEDGEVCYIEVKGCSLSIEGRALFPDAPTSRGKRHVEELIDLRKKGTGAAVIFLVLAPNARIFSPKKDTDPEFSRVLEIASKIGVKIFPVDLDLVDEKVIMNGLIPLEFI